MMLAITIWIGIQTLSSVVACAAHASDGETNSAVGAAALFFVHGLMFVFAIAIMVRQ